MTSADKHETRDALLLEDMERVKWHNIFISGIHI